MCTPIILVESRIRIHFILVKILGSVQYCQVFNLAGGDGSRKDVVGNCRYYVNGMFESQGLTISDGENSETYCGTSIPNTLVRSGPVEISFTSVANTGFAGFELDYSCDVTTTQPSTTPTTIPSTEPPTDPPFVCGEDVFGPSGSIKSPGWPKSYPPNAQCRWNIICENGATPKLDVIWGDMINTVQWGANAGCG